MYVNYTYTFHNHHCMCLIFGNLIRQSQEKFLKLQCMLELHWENEFPKYIQHTILGCNHQIQYWVGISCE